MYICICVCVCVCKYRKYVRCCYGDNIKIMLIFKERKRAGMSRFYLNPHVANGSSAC